MAEFVSIVIGIDSSQFEDGIARAQNSMRDERWLRWETAEGRTTKAHLLDRDAGIDVESLDAVFACGVRHLGGVDRRESSIVVGGRPGVIFVLKGQEWNPEPGDRLGQEDLCRACARGADEEERRRLLKWSLRYNAMAGFTINSPTSLIKITGF